MAITTVPAPTDKHLLVYVAVAIAAVALVASVLIGMAVADSGSGTDFTRTGSGVSQELPTRFGEGRSSSASTTGHSTDPVFHGSPDAIERQATSDPARYGSPDAAEEWNR
jgi:hypothetical protein